MTKPQDTKTHVNLYVTNARYEQHPQGALLCVDLIVLEGDHAGKVINDTFISMYLPKFDRQRKLARASAFYRSLSLDRQPEVTTSQMIGQVIGACVIDARLNGKLSVMYYEASTPADNELLDKRLKKLRQLNKERAALDERRRTLQGHILQHVPVNGIKYGDAA